MKLTLAWLKEYLNTKASLEEIVQTLTGIGLEVESYEDESKALSYFEVAKIVAAKNHENSDKLKICEVEVVGGKILQIICGAKNARAGIKVAYAPIGAVIPANKMVIKKAKIAGVESNGMLCSARELGLGDADEGIIEIDEKWEIGTKIAQIFNKSDATIEINVTPNRGDCLGIYGIARDLAASRIGQLITPEIPNFTTLSIFQNQIEAVNNAKKFCLEAQFIKIKNVKNCESPEWLKERLQSVGIGSISAIVDITNYVMICLNRPLHAYDANKIKGEINIRLAKKDENFISLKNLEYKLDEEILVIADDEKLLGIAGIIGSNNSSCEINSQDIIIESAYFTPSVVALGARKLNILSDAKYRFERGVDPASCAAGLNLAAKLILEICGGEICATKKIVGDENNRAEIEFDFNLVKKLTGLEINKNKALDILQKLEFEINELNEERILVKVPSHRSDVAIAPDLVEEIVRIYGYDKISLQKLEISSPDLSVDILDKTRMKLVANHMSENINWSFVAQKLVAIFSEVKKPLTLTNPISADLDHMRPNLIIGLLQSYQRNYLRGNIDASFFEIGTIFEGSDEKLQKTMVSGIRAGKNKDKNHYLDARDFDIFDVKKDLLDVAEIFGLKASSLQISTADAPKYYHPHRFCSLKLGKNIVGYFGEIHPKITKFFDLKTTINAFEIFVDHLPKPAKSIVRKSFTINDLQKIERDFAFLIDKNQAIGDFIKTIENCDKQLISQVDIFDIYSGKNIDESKKSIALRVIIQPLEKTLTSQEIDNLSQKIISEVEKSHQATLRS